MKKNKAETFSSGDSENAKIILKKKVIRRTLERKKESILLNKFAFAEFFFLFLLIKASMILMGNSIFAMVENKETNLWLSLQSWYYMKQGTNIEILGQLLFQRIFKMTILHTYLRV